jgi:hypothetical protein
MEENLNGDAMAYFKRIEIYQKLRQTDRQIYRPGYFGRGRWKGGRKKNSLSRRLLGFQN